LIEKLIFNFLQGGFVKFISLFVSAVIFYSPVYSFAKCDAGDETIFSCLTSKSKLIEVCDAGKTISYSFGYPNARPEIVVTVPRGRATTYQWDGVGRYTLYMVNIPNANTVYNVFFGYDKLLEPHKIQAGVNVKANNKIIATIKCVDESNIIQSIDGVELRKEF